ncbi:hypothetical protein Tco_0655310 [Tanacetum coccineum]|uniref:Uncharacterized protein n=1 Tax=Tanacetum coccineum TaxID=301880 RepID=A0ABQ4X6R8_9ASTR
MAGVSENESRGRTGLIATWHLLTTEEEIEKKLEAVEVKGEMGLGFIKGSFVYHSEEYFDDAHEDDENNHSNGNVESGKHRALFLSFLGDMVLEHIGLKEFKHGTKPQVQWHVPSCPSLSAYNGMKGTDAITVVLGKEKEGYASGMGVVLHNYKSDRERQEKELLHPQVSLVDIHLVNSSADEEGKTTIVGCDQNDTSIQKEMQKGETDIRQKDEKQSQKRQNRARNGKV